MKKSLILCLLVSLLALPLYAQKAGGNKVTLAFKQVPLSTALKQIEKTSGDKILFVYDDVKDVVVNTDVKNATTTQAVDAVLKGTNLSYAVKGNYITVAKRTVAGKSTPRAGEFVITGFVTDEDKEPLPGVVVRMVGNNGGTVTDVNGYFQMSVPSDCKQIEAQYLGMTPERVVIGNGRDIRIEMHANNILNDVIVTGYQDIKKEKITGAAVTIRADKLDTRYTPNLLNNLEGRVAGLSTYGGDLKIRGTSSLYATTTPLLVVDGLPIEGRIEDLNPYDIESVNVLKDAAATAIYGARASNGIIVITTKNAKKAGKIDIDFQANLTISENRNVNYNDNYYLDAAQQINIEKDAYHWKYFEEPGQKGTDPIASMESAIRSGSADISPLEYAYYRWAKGEIGESDVNALAEKLSKNNFAKEYAKAVYRRNVIQQYNLALRHRSEKSQTNFTFNYKRDNLGMINNKFDAFNISVKTTYEIAKWLSATLSVDGLFTNRREKGDDYTGSQFDQPWAVPAYASMYNEDGSLHLFHPWYDGNDYQQIPTGYRNQGYDIVGEYYNNTVNTRRQRMRYHGDLLFKLYKGLTVNAQFVYETDKVSKKWHANEASHVSAVIRNAYTQSNPDGTISYLTPSTGGMLQTDETNGDYYTARAQANYSETFGKHAVDVIAGFEFRQTLYKGTKSLVLGYDDQLQTSQTHTVNFNDLMLMRYNNYSLMFPDGGYPSSQFAFNPYLRDGMGIINEVKHRYASGYANATYTYDTKYNVFGSIRKDYADVYGLNAKFRGKPLWSIGAGWNAHNELFMKDVNWVNLLKLRLTYGVTGNIYQGATSYMTASVEGNNDYTGLPMASIVSPGNPNLKWEQSRTTNVGIDFALLNYRLNGSIDFYYKKSLDLFSMKTLDPTTGYSSQFVNSADMVNKGLEIQLSAVAFQANKQKDFGWDISATFSYNNNNVTNVDMPATRAYELASPSDQFVVGYPASAMWSYRFAGYEDINSSHGASPGETLWYTDDAKNPTGEASHYASGKGLEILEYSGQTDPKYILGLDNRFKWNGLSLSVMMTYYGGHVMRALPVNDGYLSYIALSTNYLRPWTPEETNPTGPGIGRYNATSMGSEPSSGNNAVYNAAFIKVRNIVLGYDFPSQLTKKWSIEHLGLRFQINNPGAIWYANNRNIDPETLALRNPSSFVFGLNINF